MSLTGTGGLFLWVVLGIIGTIAVLWCWRIVLQIRETQRAEFVQPGSLPFRARSQKPPRMYEIAVAGEFYSPDRFRWMDIQVTGLWYTPS
jgi:hypothetical protein